MQTGQNVLIIGTGPSGVDLVIHLSNIAKRITISRNKPKHETKEQYEKRQNSLPSKSILKDNVKHFTSNGAEFIDGTRDTFDTIIYATGKLQFILTSIFHELIRFITNEYFAGYLYSYPFLSVDSGIHVEDNFVQPLYKHIFNIEHPTMAFIGLPMTSNNFHTFDLQVNFS